LGTLFAWRSSFRIGSPLPMIAGRSDPQRGPRAGTPKPSGRGRSCPLSVSRAARGRHKAPPGCCSPPFRDDVRGAKFAFYAWPRRWSSRSSQRSGSGASAPAFRCGPGRASMSGRSGDSSSGRRRFPPYATCDAQSKAWSSGGPPLQLSDCRFGGYPDPHRPTT
jgi:hypothetical protein